MFPLAKSKIRIHTATLNNLKKFIWQPLFVLHNTQRQSIVIVRSNNADRRLQIDQFILIRLTYSTTLLLKNQLHLLLCEYFTRFSHCLKILGSKFVWLNVKCIKRLFHFPHRPPKMKLLDKCVPSQRVQSKWMTIFIDCTTYAYERIQSQCVSHIRTVELV